MNYKEGQLGPSHTIIQIYLRIPATFQGQCYGTSDTVPALTYNQGEERKLIK